MRVLYVSPLKALGVDVERNLRSPIAGVRAAAERDGIIYHVPSVGVRSGDTPAAERHRLNREPPEILITTPESLYLILTSRARDTLRTVDTVIVDEIHSLVGTKRGSHLFVSLERLEALRRAGGEQRKPLQRIGLSATQRPLEEVARLLGGAEASGDPNQAPIPRPVQIIEAGRSKQLELTVEVPVEDMARLAEPQYQPGSAAAGPTLPSIWPAIHPRLVELVRQHRSTMIFVNSRRLAERLAASLNELAGEELALAHHGSIAKDTRLQIEDRLKRGQLPAIVATSSLELGIDMGAVDLVIQIEAPPSIASGIQRIGRAGHQVGASSTGIVFPKYRGDLLACSAATERMMNGEVEETFYPRNPLDVLAQQLVAIISDGRISVDQLYALVRGAAPFADLPRATFENVLDLLAGRYPSDDFSELRPRINWDRIAGQVAPRQGAQRIAILNGGTIPDRGLYGVFLADADGKGSRVGELDEEMVFETHPGDVFLLGASSWRVMDITHDRVLVTPAPGEPGKMPFWKGDGPGRPAEFGRAIGQLARRLVRQPRDQAESSLIEGHGLERRAAQPAGLFASAGRGDRRRAQRHDDHPGVLLGRSRRLADCDPVAVRSAGPRPVGHRRGRSAAGGNARRSGPVVVRRRDRVPDAGIRRSAAGRVVLSGAGRSRRPGGPRTGHDGAVRRPLSGKRGPGPAAAQTASRSPDAVVAAAPPLGRSAGGRHALSRFSDRAGNLPGMLAGRVRPQGPDRRAAGRPIAGHPGADGRNQIRIAVRRVGAVQLRRQFHLRRGCAAGRAAGADAGLGPRAIARIARRGGTPRIAGRRGGR